MIAISSCLAGICCKYNGGHNGEEIFRKLVADGKAVCICPEVLGGLSVPRCPVELVNGRAITNTGDDVTEQFILGAKKALEICKENHITEVILKSKSPTCGKDGIYDGTFSHTIIRANGMTAQLLLLEGISVKTEEEYKKEIM